MAGLRSDVRDVSRGWRWGKRPLVPRSAEEFRPAHEAREFPTDWARGPAGRAAREAIQSYLLKPLVWNETRVSIHGLDNLREVQAPVMFVSNHSSHLDAPLVLCSLPKAWRERTAVGAAADYFFDVWWRSMTTALVFNAFPIERGGTRRASDTARRLVHDGWSLLVFPEGTRSREGWMQRFRLGAARLSIDLGLPVVPIAIRGAYSAMPRGLGWPRRGRFPVSVRYGGALRPRDGEDLRGFSSRVSEGVTRLWDEDETTWWESLKRQAEGTTPTPTGPDGARWRRVWEASRPIANGSAERVWSRR
jgi:1-acyl-sn-glycerol-3-phosphate acyltransferase